MATEIKARRTERNKTLDLGNGQKQLLAHGGAIHWCADYSRVAKDWEDIDLTWEGNQITKAPFILTHEDKKLTIYNRRTKEFSTIELLDIGGKKLKDKVWVKTKANAKAADVVTLEEVDLDTDLVIDVQNTSVKFTRVLKSDKAPKDAKFYITGNNWQFKAVDAEGKEVKVVSTLVGDILTEEIEPDVDTVYPVRVDPTWQVAADTDDCYQRTAASDWSAIVSYFIAGRNNTLGYGSAARFINVSIPVGSTINTATLILTCDATNALGSVNTRIRCEKNVAPVTFVNVADFNSRTWTTAKVNWDAIPAWTAETEYTSDDFATPLQEVADLGALTHIVVFMDDYELRSTNDVTRTRSSYSHNGSAAKAPVLSVTWTEAAATGHGWWK